MNTHADKAQENKNDTTSNNPPGVKGHDGSALTFTDNRPGTVSQRKLAEAMMNSPRSLQLKTYQQMINAMYSPGIIQKRPTLPTQIQDHQFVALLTTGALQPVKATIRDERSRRDGTPQTLSMLEYTYQGQRVFVHIHIAEGTYFGHIDMAGGNRLPITSGQSAVILRIAEESGIATGYSTGAQDWERGESGHETK